MDMEKVKTSSNKVLKRLNELFQLKRKSNHSSTEIEETEGEEDQEKEVLDDLQLEDELPEGFTLLNIPFEVWAFEILSFIGSTINILNISAVSKSFYIVAAHALKNRKIKSRFAIQRVFEKEPSEEFIKKLVEWKCFDLNVGKEFLIEMCIKHKYPSLFEYFAKDDVSSVGAMIYEITELYENDKEREIALKMFDFYSQQKKFDLPRFLQHSKYEIINQSFRPIEDNEKTEKICTVDRIFQISENSEKIEDQAIIIMNHTNYFQQFIITCEQEYASKTYRNKNLIKNIIENDYNNLLIWCLHLFTFKPERILSIAISILEERSIDCLISILRLRIFDLYFEKTYDKFQKIMSHLLFNYRLNYGYDIQTSKDVNVSDMRLLFHLLYDRYNEWFDLKFLKYLTSTTGIEYDVTRTDPNLGTILPFFICWMQELANNDQNKLNIFFQKHIIPYTSEKVTFLTPLLTNEKIRTKINWNYRDGECLRKINLRNYELVNLILDLHIVDPFFAIMRICKNKRSHSWNELINENVDDDSWFGLDEGKIFKRMVDEKKFDPTRNDNILFRTAVQVERKHKMMSMCSKLLFDNERVKKSMKEDFSFYDKK